MSHAGIIEEREGLGFASGVRNFPRGFRPNPCELVKNARADAFELSCTADGEVVSAGILREKFADLTTGFRCDSHVLLL